MMTGIIPCLYNSFSFTLENITGGDILSYETRSTISKTRGTQSTTEYSSDTALLQSSYLPVSMPASLPVVLPKPMFTKSQPESESESDTETETDAESKTNSVIDTDTETESEQCRVVSHFHPDQMKQYLYETENTDTVLWSLYVMLYGSDKYEMIENHYVESNRFKFELIEVFRENKPILKANKIKLNSIEESLVHKPFITLETLDAISVCKSLSLCIIQGRKFYETSGGGGGGGGGCGGGPFVIEKIRGKFVLYIAPENVITNYIAYVRENYWRMENISTPIRPISAYKLQDLVDISQKLNLPTATVIPGKFGSIGVEKRKTKPELYEAICRCV